MPENSKLNVDETFESQKQIVTTKIIPALLKVIDPETYPIGEGILYEMIHQRHCHQREEALRKTKTTDAQTKESMHRHKNSCFNNCIYFRVIN